MIEGVIYMVKYAVEKILKDEKGNDYTTLFYRFNNGFVPDSEDGNLLELVGDCVDLYNEINQTEDRYQITRLDGSEKKSVKDMFVPVGSIEKFLLIIIKKYFKDYFDLIRKGESPEDVMNKIINENSKKNVRR